MPTRGVFDDALVMPALGLNMAGFTGAQIIQGIAKVMLSVTPSSVPANTTVEQSVAVTGCLPGDSVDVTPPALTAGVVLANSRVSAAGTVQLQFVNSTAGALTPPSGTYIFVFTR